jgi:predicted nucleic acid-binding protein
MGNLAGAPVLDSDVLIDHLRGVDPGHAAVTRLVDSIGFFVTSVSAFELARGRGYGADPGPADALLAAPCLTLTRAAGVRAGSLLRDLRARGMTIDVRDAMLAGICLDAGAALMTRNVRHFARVPGLEVIEPSDWLR